MNATQIKILEAAEREFSEKGFHGASIRKITTEAGANVAAVNYHFGSKEALFVELIRYRVTPINRMRLDKLAQALEANNGAALSLEQLIEILVRPLVDSFHRGSATETGYHFMRAMGRGLAEESSFMATLYDDILSEVIVTFRGELERSLAPIPGEFVNLIYAYLGSTLSGCMQNQPKIKRNAAKGTLFPDSDHLIPFLIGGIRAMADNYKRALPKS